MLNQNRVSALLFCLLILIAGSYLHGATPCNLRIPEYPGSSTKNGRADTSDVYAIDHEVFVPLDATSGRPTGTRVHRVLTVLKEIDKATPGINKAVALGQTLKQVTLDFYRMNWEGAEVKYYTITLTEVRIVGAKVMMPTSFDPAYADYRHMEEVRFSYGAITWNWLPDGVIESDKNR